MKRIFAGLAFLLFSLSCAAAELAIVLRDGTPMRSAASSGARPHTLLEQGETVEVRGERLDYLQVYDYRHERGGYVRASQVRRLALSAQEAPELLAVVRFLVASPGSEPLGIAFAAAYIEAAPAEALNGPAGVEVLDAYGTLAERLARSSRRDLDVVTQ
ncbi:MAG TPA: SH3 domain-containing protein [Burkholderiales bacterium]|nr:SH3 domain-containing protein [Burkholderiales bacterium]